MGAVYRVEGPGLEADGAGGQVCVEMVYGRVGSQGAAQFEIGGVVPFVDVEQVLIVDGDRHFWSSPGSFNLHLARSGHIQLAGAGVTLPQSDLAVGRGKVVAEESLGM